MENNENKEKDLTRYFYKMFIIFVLIDLGITFLPEIITTFISGFKYGEDIINEIFYALFALIIMLLFKNSYVFTNKQDKFYKGIIYALPLVIYSIVKLIMNAVTLTSFSIGNLINAIILCILIGITEEFLCRGWLQNEFMERFGDSKRNVLTSIFLSSLIFGFMHVADIIIANQGVLETLIQVSCVTAFGFLLGTVYYKTKNIWSVIFLHILYHFSGFISEVNQVKECTYSVASTSIKLMNIGTAILLCVFFILSSIIVIKKTNYPDKKAKRNKKEYSKLLTVVILVCASLFIPYELFIKDFDEYKVCYNYNSIELDSDFTSHYPLYDKYIISDVKNIASLYIENSETQEVEEHFAIDEINISLELRNKKLLINNINISESVYAPYENISSFEVLENEDSYQIVLLTHSEDASTVYYSDYIRKDNLSNEKDYLNKIAASFKTFEVPYISEIGYITINENSEKYAFISSRNKDKFIIKDNEIYLVEKKGF